MLWPTSAAGQFACSPRNEVLTHLAKKYGEAPVGVGVTNKGGLVEVLTTGDGDTWTIIVSMPDGTSCMVAFGEGWRFLERAIKEPKRNGRPS
jgi:hypothetical protein